MKISLLMELARRDFTEKYSGSALGALWSLLWPMVNIFIYTIVFGKIMSSRLEGVSIPYGYSVYLIAGIVPWTAFANTVSRSATVFTDRKNIISKVKIALPFFPLFIVISESVTFVFTMLLFFCILLVTGNPITGKIFYLPLIYLAQQLFAYALGFFIAIFQVFIRDLKEVTNITLQVWFWFTPIVYVYNILPDFAEKFVRYNPAYLFVKAYHDIFVFDAVPSPRHLIVLTALGFSILFGAHLLFKKLERDVRDFL